MHKIRQEGLIWVGYDPQAHKQIYQQLNEANPFRGSGELTFAEDITAGFTALDTLKTTLDRRPELFLYDENTPLGEYKLPNELKSASLTVKHCHIIEELLDLQSTPLILLHKNSPNLADQLSKDIYKKSGVNAFFDYSKANANQFIEFLRMIKEGTLAL